jgi:hypothetical protein
MNFRLVLEQGIRLLLLTITHPPLPVPTSSKFWICGGHFGWRKRSSVFSRLTAN